MVNSGLRTGDHFLSGFYAAMLYVLLICIALAVVSFVIFLTLRLRNRRRLAQIPYVTLQLIPPLPASKTPLATTELFRIIHELAQPTTLLQKLLLLKNSYSFEIVSNKQRGIRFLLRVPEAHADTLKRHISAYLPGVHIRKLTDYALQLSGHENSSVMTFSQTSHPLVPLKVHDNLDVHDPIAYMTGAMTQLKQNEIISLQLLVAPARHYLNHTKRLQRASYKRYPSIKSIAWLVFGLQITLRFLWRIVNLVQIMALDKPKLHRQVAKGYGIMHDEEDVARQKAKQPLFEVYMRTYISASSKTAIIQRRRALQSSLATFDDPASQSLRARKTIGSIGERSRVNSFVKRLPSLQPHHSCLFSATELAALYHFPATHAGYSENVQTSLSRSLPAPISLKQRIKQDVYLGANIHNGQKTAIGLTASERERHVYVVGGTGSGKTTLLTYAIEQDIRNGKGLAVIDPHGDLAETVLKHIPKSRLQDVIYFNPDDIDYPLGMNLLELPAGLSAAERIREKDLISETVVSVFRKIFAGEDYNGHRIEYVLRNTIQTALSVEDATIFTIFRLLTNDTYRKQVVAGLTDTDLVDFWNNEMGKAGDYQRIKMSAGITAKVGRFLFSASAKRVLGQPHSTLDFDDIVSSGKILVCNFSKGLLGEDTTSLFGITVLAKLQIATLRRARLNVEERRPFHLYVDEFQNFATMSFVQLLSEARKYKLFVTMAEQSTSQQPEQRIVNIILANVGTVICFRTANPADEQLLLPLFAPFITTGEISYLAPYHFYVRKMAIRSEEPFSGQTVPLKKPRDVASSNEVIDSSRKHFAQLPPADSTMPIRHEVDDYEIDYPLALA